MQASRGSAHTLGDIGIQMLYDFDKVHYDKVDAVLQGPTSLTWIEPWVTHLKSEGVVFHNRHELLSIVLAPPPANPAAPCHVQSVVFWDDVNSKQEKIDVSGGYGICAVPIDRIGALLTSALTSADPALANLSTLITSAPKPWSNMIGVQYYLDVDDPMLMGH